MAEVRSAPLQAGIREEIRPPLTLFVERLQIKLGDNLKSVSAVGSSLTQDYQPKVSDINTVVLLDNYDLPALNAVAQLAPQMSRYKLSPPLLMTPVYIQRSCDVFGVEFLDFQLIHETIFGEDPFLSLRFDKKSVRLQCERELKSMLVRLRQGYIAAAGDKRMIHDLLISATKGLIPLLRAMLWLVDADRPRTMDSTLRKAAGEFNVDVGAVLVVQHWRHEKVRLTDAEMESAFVAIVDAVDRLTTTVDNLEL